MDFDAVGSYSRPDILCVLIAYPSANLKLTHGIEPVLYRSTRNQASTSSFMKLERIVQQPNRKSLPVVAVAAAGAVAISGLTVYDASSRLSQR